MSTTIQLTRGLVPTHDVRVTELANETDNSLSGQFFLLLPLYRNILIHLNFEIAIRVKASGYSHRM